MKEYFVLLLLIVGFFFPLCWLAAWVLGRKCTVCETRNRHAKGQAEVLPFKRSS